MNIKDIISQALSDGSSVFKHIQEDLHTYIDISNGKLSLYSRNQQSRDVLLIGDGIIILPQDPTIENLVHTLGYILNIEVLDILLNTNRDLFPGFIFYESQEHDIFVYSEHMDDHIHIIQRKDGRFHFDRSLIEEILENHSYKYTSIESMFRDINIIELV